MREALGDHVCDYLVRNKLEEWDEYKTLVTPYELRATFPSSRQRHPAVGPAAARPPGFFLSTACFVALGPHVRSGRAPR